MGASMAAFPGIKIQRRRSRLSFLSMCITFLVSSLILCSARAQSASDYYVHSLPGAPSGPLLKMHAGHIEVTPETHGNLFFWHFQNRHIGDRQRTVIWLNGGPGCSSMDGALMEVGPYRVREGGKLEYNDGSWDEFANLLFVDNPVGTGFSYVDTNAYIHELQEMADQFITFLEKWFAIFPEYEHDDIYLAGESYAGQHLPYIARAILARNRNMSKVWRLKGMLIGNGWTSPVDQYPAYLQFAYKSGLLEAGSNGASQVEAQQAICVKKLADGGMNHVDTIECESILLDILRVTQDSSKPADQRCVNMYDVRLRDSYSSCGMNWPPDLEYVTPYLRQRDVVASLNVNMDKVTGWTECNGDVGKNFKAYHSLPAIRILPEILEQVPTVLFSGDQDLICNHIGTENLIHNMEWSGGKGFETAPGVWAPRHDWNFEGEPAGIIQEARNLTYVLFYNSSHMVPFDYARRSRDMLDRFMGVDIASVGGKPSDSRIDGEKGVQTSVGGHPNSTVAEEEEQSRLEQAKWDAYYRSGEVALVVVIIAASLWGWYVWRDRRRRAGYRNLPGDAFLESVGSAIRADGSHKRAGRTDLEAADFDERQLEHMPNGHGRTEMERERYSLGSLDDEDDTPGQDHSIRDHS